MMVVSVTADIRVAVEISTNVFNCMFCGGICGVDSGSCGSYIGWVVMVVVMMVMFWWSRDGGDDCCCNGGSCD